ncbi:MAG: thiamine-phosphate kinase [Leptolyngbyaceae cyanobacterium SM1_1_3]|nr:thiamine-phosphate kinase [Leptolyngbyaceae cyanobacterium SM1_1_3]NJN02275.1 thiamine-phosphate kinase [Leptolyngbyaceae cyanobacterium RM1_1_2]NJO08445.1 thiamine-phosphate kinase [Leptolyngbyaceae cyanobacterium SL_1_1]
MTSPTVKQLGEIGLLQYLRRFCPAEALADDGAVLSVAPGYQLVVTTDVLVEDVHFSDRTTRPEDVGWRATAANLSDLAAMGAEPLGITLGLGLPETTSLDWIGPFYQGIGACLSRYGGVILGGDLCRAPVVTVSITALGQVRPQHILRRSAALAGDAIVVTGNHGGARAGLELLLLQSQGATLSAIDQQCLIKAHQRPQPRFDVLPVLWQVCGLLSRPIAAMDSSDGLANAVLQICRESQVGAQIVRSQLPMPPALIQWRSETEALNWCLYGGEDFELVLALPPELAADFVAEVGEPAAIVGTFTDEPAVTLGDSQNGRAAETLSLEQGFQHF